MLIKGWLLITLSSVVSCQGQEDSQPSSLKSITMDPELQGLTLHVSPEKLVSFYYKEFGDQITVRSPYRITLDENSSLIWHRDGKSPLQIGAIVDREVIMCRRSYDAVCDARFLYGIPGNVDADLGQQTEEWVGYLELDDKTAPKP